MLDRREQRRRQVRVAIYIYIMHDFFWAELINIHDWAYSYLINNLLIGSMHG